MFAERFDGVVDFGTVGKAASLGAFGKALWIAGNFGDGNPCFSIEGSLFMPHDELLPGFELLLSKDSIESMSSSLAERLPIMLDCLFMGFTLDDGL